MKIEKNYETNVVVSITMPDAIFRNFEETCKENHKQPLDVLKEFIEFYADLENEII